MNTFLKFRLINLSLLLFTLMSCNSGKDRDGPNLESVRINLLHLDHLSEVISIDSESMLIVYIYSDYPDYEPVTAAGEGIACVDDVGRAVLVFLKYYEQFGEEEYLQKSRLALRFIMHMQAEDGEFYNFIYQNHEINRNGVTSRKSFGYWAVRALRALAYGYKVFASNDPAFADSLDAAVERTFPHIESVLAEYGSYENTSPVRTPGWLLQKAGDQSSELLLALLDYHKATGSEKVAEYIGKFCDGIAEYQINNGGEYSGVHLSWENLWHAWGSHQVQALARAARVFDNEEWLESAKRGADFLSVTVGRGFLNELTFESSDSVTVSKFPQIAYGAHTITGGLMETYIASGDEGYKNSMDNAVKWFFGENDANEAMYDPGTGRTFDGIDSAGINRNSGAESTIEALLTFLELKENGL